MSKAPSYDARVQSSRRIHKRPHDCRRLSLVVVLAGLVHGLTAVAASALDNASLPPQVAELRELILSAVRSGNIEDLRTAIDRDGVRPDFGLPASDDAIAALKTASSESTGHETLAALAEILEMPPAALPLGKDIENNLIYVWPYLAERPINALSAPETVDLDRLVPAAKVREMHEKKRWTWWRLAIGADGSCIMFKKME